jgi:hypothetical protein
VRRIGVIACHGSSVDLYGTSGNPATDSNRRETADHFGSSVGIVRRHGRPWARGGKDVGANGDQAGPTVFTKPQSGWTGTLTQNATLTASDGAAGDEFGSSAAIAATRWSSAPLWTITRSGSS